MDKAEIEKLLVGQIDGLENFKNGYATCAKYILGEFDKKEAKENAPTVPENPGIPAA